MGDEGSAGYFGKKVINSYFRFEFPGDLKKSLEASFNMDLDYIMSNLYGGKQKSRFVASYSKFLGDHKDHPFVQNLLREGFSSFVNRIVKNYSNAASYKVSFVGSVAFAYQDLIAEILQDADLQPGSFFRNPLERLISYHTS